MSLVTDFLVRLSAAEGSAADLAVGIANHLKSLQYSWASGIAANQADRIFSDTRTLGASATEDLDLTGTTNLPGIFGNVNFTKVKLLLFAATSGNTNNVNVTRPASNGLPIFLAASDGLAIPPGGLFLLVGPALAGLATVTAGTGDLVTVTNSAGGTGITYDVIIIGTSA